MFKIVEVILRCKCTQRRKTVPRDSGEIVVLNMVTNVQAESVDGSVHGVGRLSLLDEVMFLDLSHAKWMQSIHETGGKELVCKEFPAKQVNNSDIVHNAAEDVDCHPSIDALRESIERNSREFGWVKRFAESDQSHWNGNQHGKSQQG